VFHVYKAVQALLQPELWILAALVAAALLGRRPERLRLARRLVIAAALLLLGFGTRATASLIVRPLEEHYPRPALPLAPHEAIVVLAGGSHVGRGDPAAILLGTRTLDRLVQGLRLHRQGAAPLLVVSGRGSRIPEAESMRALAVELGVPAAEVLVEARSRTTAENAREVRRLLPRAQRIVLVTSALHLRRATLHFRRAGFTVTPVPADYLSPAGFGVTQLWPRSDALAASGVAIHEWVGLLAAGLGLGG
jgi:uncharacterized SAM-binding protein YcdF (DUF218 family)